MTPDDRYDNDDDREIDELADADYLPEPEYDENENDA